MRRRPCVEAGLLAMQTPRYTRDTEVMLSQASQLLHSGVRCYRLLLRDAVTIKRRLLLQRSNHAFAAQRLLGT